MFDGRMLQLDRNDKEGPNAIHGFVRTVPWSLQHADSHRLAFGVRLDAGTYGRRGYPFTFDIGVTYLLDHRGLCCSFEVRNAGHKAAPVGVGFHPYFTVGTALVDEAQARIAGAEILEFNERLLPTGTLLPAAGSEWDYRDYRLIGHRRFNHCYVQLERDPDGMATAALRDVKSGRLVEVVIDRSFSAVVVYTGDAIADAPRRAFAIEPMTCATDAFNHPEWGLKRLVPGETFSGRYQVRHRREPGLV